MWPSELQKNKLFKYRSSLKSLVLRQILENFDIFEYIDKDVLNTIFNANISFYTALNTSLSQHLFNAIQFLPEQLSLKKNIDEYITHKLHDIGIHVDLECQFTRLVENANSIHSWQTLLETKGISDYVNARMEQTLTVNQKEKDMIGTTELAQRFITLGIQSNQQLIMNRDPRHLTRAEVFYEFKYGQTDTDDTDELPDLFVRRSDSMIHYKGAKDTADELNLNTYRKLLNILYTYRDAHLVFYVWIHRPTDNSPTHIEHSIQIGSFEDIVNELKNI